MATPSMFGLNPGAFWSGGPAPGQYYNFPGSQATTGQNAVQRTLSPVVTGTSVLGIQFEGGVIIAADMLGSYGSLARFRDCPRLLKVNDTTVLGAAGDYADFQYLTNVIEQQVIDEECLNDGFGYTPKSLHCWLTRVLYNRRSQFNPLWNTYIVAGLEEEKPFLGYVDKIGMAYEAPSLACGFGAYLALPIIRDAMEKNPTMTQEEAVSLIDRCMKLLYYRDARSLNKYQIAIITKAGVDLRGPIKADTNWEVAHMIK
ncbi:proteasome subunit beta [Plakobranchus ocellatus]|uniref:Proteasome subunit beta n=1 Tax=Plakobranchus ocellatus TaxID=259542 RepID=A0AAV3ZRT0_9GAST|nr:proteasome subunit beta [Plakobranchus ocellatus]